jgi:hypothetical protein
MRRVVHFHVSTSKKRSTTAVSAAASAATAIKRFGGTEKMTRWDGRYARKAPQIQLVTMTDDLASSSRGRA